MYDSSLCSLMYLWVLRSSNIVPFSVSCREKQISILVFLRDAWGCVMIDTKGLMGVRVGMLWRILGHGGSADEGMYCQYTCPITCFTLGNGWSSVSDLVLPLVSCLCVLWCSRGWDSRSLGTNAKMLFGSFLHTLFRPRTTFTFITTTNNNRP